MQCVPRMVNIVNGVEVFYTPVERKFSKLQGGAGERISD